MTEPVSEENAEPEATESAEPEPEKNEKTAEKTEYQKTETQES